MNAPFVPTVQINETIATTGAPTTLPLYACILGPQAQLVRYTQPAEQANGLLGEYNPLLAATYPWPNLALGASVDLAYPSLGLWCTNAKLAFFTYPIGSGQTVAAVGGQPNEVSITGSAAFTTANGYSLVSGLYSRSVQVGDRVRLSATTSGTTTTLDSYVTGFVGDAVAAVTGSATDDSHNAGTQTLSETVTQVAGTVNCWTLTASAASYNGLATGNIDETYTVTVIQSSTGNDPTTALLSLSSASGLDNVASFAPAASGTAVAVGSRGLQVTVTTSEGPCNLTAGQAWQIQVAQAFTATAVTAAGTYTGTSNDTYVVTITRGGTLSGGTPPQWTVTTAHGLDASGPTNLTTANTAIPIGTKGVTLKLNTGTTSVCEGDRFYVPVTAATTGRQGTLVLADNLPSALATASALNLWIYTEQSVEVTQDRLGSNPLLNWTAAASGITANAGITMQVAGFVDGSGNPIQLSLIDGTLYASYRAWLPAAALGSVATPAAIPAALGTVDPDNPLAFGVNMALANSNGLPVKYVGTGVPTIQSNWAAALAAIDGRTDVYKLVPLTWNKTFLSLVQADVDNQSGPEVGCNRSAFFGVAPTITEQLVGQATSSNGNQVMATLAASSGTNYNQLTITSGNASLITANVQPGDTVRYFFTTEFGAQSYTSFTVASVTSQTTLLLSTSASMPVTQAQLVEVWHTLSYDEQVDDLISQAAAYSDARVCCIFSDLLSGWAGNPTIPYYYVACALAGQRSGLPPQQSLTGSPVAGLAAYAAPTGYLNGTQVGTLCGNGVWIVTTTPQIANGAPLTRLATTTLPGEPVNIATREEMIRSNVDSMELFMRQDLLPYISGVNMVSSALAAIRTQLVAAHTYLQTSGYTDALGGQLVSFVINSIAQHAVLLDTLVIDVTWVVPGPINAIEFDVTLVVGSNVSASTATTASTTANAAS